MHPIVTQVLRPCRLLFASLSSQTWVLLTMTSVDWEGALTEVLDVNLEACGNTGGARPGYCDDWVIGQTMVQSMSRRLCALFVQVDRAGHYCSTVPVTGCLIVVESLWPLLIGLGMLHSPASSSTD